MGLGSDDSGAFRVAPAGNEASREVRLPARPALPSNDNPSSGNPANVNSGSAPPKTIELKPAANSHVRITGLPPPKAPPDAAGRPPAREHATSGGSTGSVPRAINPPRALDSEGWVRLPSGGQATLRYRSWRQRVSVSARKLEFPSQCPCCMRAADAQLEAHVAKTRDRQNTAVWTFPYCASCVDHVRKARWMRYGSRALGVVAALLLGAIGYVFGGLVAAGVAAIVAGAAAWIPLERMLLRRVAAGMASSCACYGPAVRVAEFYGSVQHFDFASSSYAEAFRRANEKKLV